MSSNFGKNLKIARKQKKLSQIDMAEDLGFTHNQISDWETGRSIPNIEQVCKICKYLNKNISDMVECNEDKPNI